MPTLIKWPLLVPAVVVLVSLMTACGNSDKNDQASGSGDVTVIVQPDLSAVPAAEQEAVLLETALILQERVAQLDGEAAAQANDDGTISVRIRGVPQDQAAQLLGRTARLSFAAPKRDADGNMLCTTPDGAEAAVPRDAFEYDASGLPVCTLADDSNAEITWQDVFGSDEVTALDGSMLLENGVVFMRDSSPALVVNFNTRGSALLNEISVKVLNAPLGILIDDQLVGGPKVTEPLATGNVVITGISARDARIIRAQLNAGELPVPLRGAEVEG